MGSPWHLLALFLLPTSLAPTLHHRAYAVAVPPITEGALAPPVGGVTGRASTNDAPNATEELETLKHHGVDRTAAWDALEMGGAESTATPDRPDLGQSSLKDARGPAALGNVFAGTPQESGEAVAVAEDDARNGTGARLTARLSLNGPRLSTLRGEESPSESSETFLVATSPSPEKDAFSPVTMSGDSSQDQVRNTDAPTRAVTSLDDSVLEEGVSRTTAFPEEAWVSDISPTLNTTEGVVAPNLPSSRESERASEAPPPNLKEAMTLPERNGSRDSSPTDLPETTTDLPILLGENASIIEVQLTNPAKTHISPQNSTELVEQTTGNYLELDRTLYRTTDIPETTTDLPILLGENASIIEVQLTNPAKTHISLQNSTELVAQTTETPEKYLEQDRTLYRTTNIPETTTDLPTLLGENASIIEVQLTNPAKTHISPQNSTELVVQTTETPENYLEQDRTLYRVTEASKQTSSGVLQEEHLELPTASSTPLGIKNPHGLLALLTTQASATTASSIVHNTKEPVVLLGLPTTTSTLGSVLTNLAQDVHPHWPNISGSFPGNAGAAEVRPLETASPEVLDVWTEDSGNGSRRRPADTSTEEPYGVSEPQAPPATSSSGEVTTARRVTDQEEGAFANASVPIATSVEVEASAPPNGTFALEEDGLWVHLVSTHTATGPAVDRTEERQLPVATTPAESFVEDSEVLSPAKSTTSLESAAVGDDAPTTIPARDLDAVETPSSREESATKTDFTEDAAPTNRPDTVGLTTQLPASTPPCVPLEPPRGLTHEFRLVFRTASEFSWERVEALERRIQGFLRDGPCPRRFARTAFALGPPHVLSWTDPSANATWCDHASVEALLRTMRSESGRPTPAITRAFYPEFLISSVELQLRGACASEAGAFPIVAAVVGAALSAALLAGLLAVLCRYLRPRSRRLDVTPAGDSFDLKQRRPVLLPGEGGRASADGTPRKAPRAPFVVDTDFCYINPNFLEVARPSPPAPPYRPEPPPHGPRSAPGGPDDLASSSSGVESDPSAGEAADAS